MSKYAVMIILDLDVKMDFQASKALEKVPIGKFVEETVEGITKLRIKALIENKTKGLEIKMIRAKYLGIAK